MHTHAYFYASMNSSFFFLWVFSLSLSRLLTHRTVIDLLAWTDLLIVLTIIDDRFPIVNKEISEAAFLTSLPN